MIDRKFYLMEFSPLSDVLQIKSLFRRPAIVIAKVLAGQKHFFKVQKELFWSK